MNDKSVTQASADAMPTLHDYITGAELRPATAEEHRASIRAARFDGGAGVIVLDDGRRCYVTDPCPATLPATGRSADAWWAWHDADPSRWSPGEDPLEATADAERRCTAWLRGESTDGPDTISRTAPGEHYSFLPIDVGFDPRTCGISVELPADAGSVTLDDDGIQRRVEGSRTELVEALRGAGYTVAEVTP